MDKEIQNKLYSAFLEINEGMEAHLIESIISLFHQGVLKHYIRSPRHNFNKENFKLSIEAANGVRFEGREKLIEMEKELKQKDEALNTAIQLIEDAKIPVENNLMMVDDEEDEVFMEEWQERVDEFIKKWSLTLT